jgi:hypothetical protein
VGPIVIPKEIELPDSLYRTWHAMKRFPSGATAKQLSDVTGRARAVESHYSNILCLLGVFCKQRRRKGLGGPEVVFKVWLR